MKLPEDLELIIVRLLQYSLEDVDEFKDLTNEEQRIVGSAENLERLNRWIAGSEENSDE